MSDHVKPTTEELEAQIQKSLEALEEAPEETEVPEEEIEQAQESEEETEETPEEESTDEEAPEETQEEKEQPQEKKTQTIEDRYKASTQEAQVLAAKNRKNQEAIQAASELPAPTDEELAIEYPDWEELTVTEKRLAKDVLWNKQKLAVIEESAKEGKNLDEWVGRVNSFIEDPATLAKYPRLEGKAEEFKGFVIKPSRRGVDFEDLISSFLYTVDESTPKHSGKMFEKGTGGSKEKAKVKSDILTVEEGRLLMKRNYPEYVKKLTAGKIASE